MPSPDNRIRIALSRSMARNSDRADSGQVNFTAGRIRAGSLHAESLFRRGLLRAPERLQPRRLRRRLVIRCWGQSCSISRA